MPEDTELDPREPFAETPEDDEDEELLETAREIFENLEEDDDF